MYELSDYEYHLPEKLIAQKPLKDRDSSRLLTINRTDQKMSIGRFSDIISFMRKGDVLVINETKVIPARVFGKKEGTSSRIEIFLLKEIEENVWEIMVKPGKKVKINDLIVLEGDASCRIQSVTDEFNRIAIFESEMNIYEYIDIYGNVPLPPYIKRPADSEDGIRYQTVYASVPGAVAAPTAGLHFTDNLLKKIKSEEIEIARIVLHVGAGTFKPVKSESIKDHKMHSESFEVSQEAVNVINSAKERGNKIFAVGTTAVRTLESVSDEKGYLKAAKGETDIYIYPGYKFKTVDHMITNFHLPKSSLMLLVSAFSTLETVKKAYELAIKEKFRFYSYGDAMLIL